MKDLGFGNEETIARWHNYFPDAPVDRIPDAGHYLQEESPDPEWPQGYVVSWAGRRPNPSLERTGDAAAEARGD